MLTLRRQSCTFKVVTVKFGRAAIVCVLCFSLGFHWLALQSAAWTSMIVQYSQHASLGKAVAQTFDGAHPCKLCKGITAAQQSEKKSDASLAPIKPDLICATRRIALRPDYTDFFFVAPEINAAARVKSPPTPPPRSELA